MATDDDADRVWEVARTLGAIGIERNDDAYLRSAVSRGYYSVFLAAQRRVRVRESEAVHGQVIYEITRSTLGHLTKTKIRIIRELRVAADYFILPVAPPGIQLPPEHADWAANWKYVELHVPEIRERLKKWKD
jgi:hypothetical protein